jgi:hypothetical protein
MRSIRQHGYVGYCTTYIGTHIHTHTYIHTYIHDIHTYIHTYTHTYIHTYIKIYLNTLALTSFDDFHRGRVRLRLIYIYIIQTIENLLLKTGIKCILTTLKAFY